MTGGDIVRDRETKGSLTRRSLSTEATVGQRNEKEALVDGIVKFDAEIGQSIANTSFHCAPWPPSASSPPMLTFHGW